MAMQTGMGPSKILILVGVGYTSTILIKNGNMTSLIVPAVAVGTLCYGCIWWKGLTFSDLMYVTKRNMANAVSNLTKHLDSVSEALPVTDVRCDLSQIGFDLDVLQRMVSGLDGKICSLEDKQEQLKVSGKPRGYLNSSEPPSLMGLKEIADSLASGNANRLISDGTIQEGIERLHDWPRTLMRYELESLTLLSNYELYR
ncbi:hypothetical protein ACSBR1_006606 [Camellia fascicularis]